MREAESAHVEAVPGLEKSERGAVERNRLEGVVLHILTLGDGQAVELGPGSTWKRIKGEGRVRKVA